MGRSACPIVGAATLLVTALGACSGVDREDLSEPELEVARTEDAGVMTDSRQKNMRDMIERTIAEVRAAERGEGPAAVMDILAISGGGDYGAFGAGFLVGWGGVGDPLMRRPEFEAVTGVSTGGLIAPFAFIGTDEACAYAENLYRNPKPDWVRTRGPLYFLPHNPSFMVLPGVEREIRSAITDEWVADVAEGRREGRMLLISATNLDLAEQRVWEIGTEAERAEETGDKERIARIMLASAAIPVVFPPIELDGFLYVDGAVTANVFLKLDPDSPDSFLQMWRREHPEVPLPKIRYWIILNNRTKSPPKTVDPRWPEVMPSSLDASIRSATLAEIRWLTAQARFVNAVYGTDIEVRMVSIPSEWRAPVPGEFKEGTMRELSDIGRRMGADPSSWTLLVSKENSKALD